MFSCVYRDQDEKLVGEGLFYVPKGNVSQTKRVLSRNQFLPGTPSIIKTFGLFDLDPEGTYLMCYQDERTTKFLVEEFARCLDPALVLRLAHRIHLDRDIEYFRPFLWGEKTAQALVDQLRSVDKSRVIKVYESISSMELSAIEDGIRLYLGL